MQSPSRRRFLHLASASVAGLAMPRLGLADSGGLLQRQIPSTGEAVPVLGMGSWITFNVGENRRERAIRVKVLEEFFSGGGGMIDSSPMYGSSETVIGYCLSQLPPQDHLFAATKVWTQTRMLGELQMKTSERLWGQGPLDLIQVHNLVDWETHLETLNEWKAAGRLRYTGVTTSHGRRHRRLAALMEREPIDFVQFTYNIEDREAEERLLPLAAERGLAVIINRPFKRGTLIDRLERKPLPDWAGEIGCASWPQFLLKFIVSHPAVTCAIPATSNPAHMRENLVAGRGVMPDAAMRRRMVDYVLSL